MEMKSLFDNVKIGWLDLADAQTEISIDEKKLRIKPGDKADIKLAAN